jgi:hypothetical protein
MIGDQTLLGAIVPGVHMVTVAALPAMPAELRKSE